MFEQQYNDEMAVEVRRIEAQQRAAAAGHPEWLNACRGCSRELPTCEEEYCETCRS